MARDGSGDLHLRAHPGTLRWSFPSRLAVRAAGPPPRRPCPPPSPRHARQSRPLPPAKPTATSPRPPAPQRAAQAGRLTPVNIRRPPRPPAPATRVWALLAGLLTAVGLLGFTATTASAAGRAAAETRVGASASAPAQFIGPIAAVSAVQGRVPWLPEPQFVVATGVAAETAGINPASVRFSQGGVSPLFKNGNSIDETVAKLSSGEISASDFPAIRLTERDGNLFTLDNRRLVAFQKAGLPEVPYRMATPEEAAAEAWKFDSKNGGTSIKIRGGGGIWTP